MDALKVSLKAREAYHEFLDQAPEVKPFREKLTQAEDHLKTVRTKLHQESKNDDELNSAQQAFLQAKTTLEKAKSSHAEVEDKVEMLEDRLAAGNALLGR